MNGRTDASTTRLLTLLRHAEALAAEAGEDDRARALSARGRRDARTIAAAVTDDAPAPRTLLCSPARRTVETARLVATELGLDEDRLVLEPALYLASADTLLDVIAARFREEPSHLLLVGHNPGLEALAARFERRARVTMSPATLRRYALPEGIGSRTAEESANGDARPVLRLLHEARPRRRRD